MNERNLSRRLSSSVVEALKAHGHILVVKGGATALARELDDLMAPEIVTIEPRIQPHAPLVGEPTSTFGDENVDQTVEDMVLKMTHALMRSDHVEDVFAEDAVIRRDIFRVVRDGLREPSVYVGGDDGDHASVTVKLDALGYVAATAGRRADSSTLRQALDRAASVAGARFSAFRPDLREATFRVEGGGPDERLDLEEAVADELADLVEQGVVDLPTIERRIDLGRPVPSAEQRSLRARIDALAETTLLRSGCAAEWELADARTLRVLFTPLSEQDAQGVDAPTSAFAREIAAVLARVGASPPVRTGYARGPAIPPGRPGRYARLRRPALRRGKSPVNLSSPQPPPPPRPSAGRPRPAPPEDRPDRGTPSSVKPAAAKRTAKKAPAKAPASSRKGATGKASTAKSPAATAKRAPAARASKAPSKKR